MTNWNLSRLGDKNSKVCQNGIKEFTGRAENSAQGRKCMEVKCFLYVEGLACWWKSVIISSAFIVKIRANK